MIARVHQAFRTTLDGSRLPPVRGAIVATEGGRVLGAVGLHSGASGQLPVEHLFDFSAESLGFKKREQIVEVMQLASDDRANLLVVEGLLAAVAQHAFNEQDIEVGLGSTKPGVRALLRRLIHIPVYELDFPVVPARVPPERREHFLGTPRAEPFMLLRKDTSNWLPRLWEKIQDRVVFELDDYDHRSNGWVEQILETV